MKYKITADEFNALLPELQELYSATGDGYTLTVDGLPDNSEELERIKAHNQKLIDERKEHDELARKIKADKLAAEQEAAKKNGDFEALEKSYQEKLQAEIDAKNELLRQRDMSTVEQTSLNLASQLADTPSNQKLLQRFVKDRLTVIDGQVKVIDAQGQPSASTLDDLANEFKTSGDYDSLLTGTRASGSGAQGQGAGATKAASEYTEAERIELANTNPDEFKRLFN